MKAYFTFILFCFLSAGVLACFEDQPLESNLQEYLALKKSCSETLFPEPPCCGNSTVEKSVSRIINGELTGLRELTWTMYINFTTENLTTKSIDSYPCGGSLLNSRWVLTAAHCLGNSRRVRLISSLVHIGEWNLTSNPDCIKGFCAPRVTIIEVAQAIGHPDFKMDRENDLAVLRLKRPVAYSEFINPICLPFKPLKKKCFENQKAIAAGWGRTVYNGDFSPVKLQTTLTIWETDKCETFESPSIDPLKDKYKVCASAGRNFTCFGDSGGPLSLKLPNSDHNYLVGVVSGGDDYCDGTEGPAIFAPINFKWIVDTILKTEANLQKSYF